MSSITTNVATLIAAYSACARTMGAQINIVADPLVRAAHRVRYSGGIAAKKAAAEQVAQAEREKHCTQSGISRGHTLSRRCYRGHRPCPTAPGAIRSIGCRSTSIESRLISISSLESIFDRGSLSVNRP
jgi:hypothetical protein